MSELTSDERERYGRHFVLPELGAAGQHALRDGSVVIVGAGGLGSPAALYLAAAGVGTIGLVDFDRVELSNLQRQVLFTTSDVGRPKLDAAAARLRDLNPHVRVTTHAAMLTSQNALEILAGYDVILDGTDNFATRYLVNDAAVLLGKPNVYGSVFRFEGQASVFGARSGPCYRCLYPMPPPAALVPSCAEGGVLGVLPGVIGTIQAIEAIKLLAGLGETLAGRLLLFDALRMSFRTLAVPKNPSCALCGTHPTVTDLIDYEQFCNPAAKRADADDIVTPAQLAERLARGDSFTLIDVREHHEWELDHLAGARHIPLGIVPDSLAQFAANGDVVLYCRSGSRSSRALALMREAGFTGAKHLEGGMLAWKKEQDPDFRL